MKNNQLDLILDFICAKRNQNVDAVKSKSRYPELVLTRQFFFYFARKYVSCPLRDIGGAVNVKTHSNVKYGIAVIEDAIKERFIRSLKHKDIANFVTLLENDIKMIVSTSNKSGLEEIEKKIESLQEQINARPRQTESVVLNRTEDQTVIKTQERMEIILDALCAKRNQNIEVVTSKRHYPELVLTRQIFFYSARKYTDSFLKQIGEFVNVQSYRVVGYGIYKIKSIMREKAAKSDKHKDITDFVKSFEKYTELMLSANNASGLEEIEKKNRAFAGTNKLNTRKTMFIICITWLAAIVFLWKTIDMLVVPDIDRGSVIRNYIQVLVDSERLMTASDKIALLKKRMDDIDISEVPMWQQDAFVKAVLDKFNKKLIL